MKERHDALGETELSALEQEEQERAEQDLALALGESLNLPNGGHIMELIDSGKVVLPTSLTFWSQPETAKQSPNAVDIPVDQHGTLVKSRITAPDGGHTSINYFDIQIEATIAQMVAENSLPLIVTPRQVYKKFAQAAKGDRITDYQVQEVIRSFDKLVKTPATLDFTQEIQNHSRLKKNPRYDYTNTVIEGTLITGLHVTQSSLKAKSMTDAERDMAKPYQYHGKIVEDVFIIYSMPMYAIHDHMVNQIATFPGRYLNSQDNPKGHQCDDPAEREPRNASHIVAMRRYILLQVNRMRKAAGNSRPAGPQEAPLRQTEKLTYDKIAEHSDITLTPRSTRTLRMNTERILNELQQEGLIFSFSNYKKGRAYEGVSITV